MVEQNKKPKLSIIIIQKNEAANIVECLKSVGFADEWIVLDSGSTDDSVQQARDWGASVYETDWPGFGPQKNRALQKAQGEWVLSIDADERVSPELATEIMNIISRDDTLSAYRMPRLSSYCGRFMRYGGWWPDYVLRLFKRDSAVFSNDLVHEHVLTDYPVGTIKNHLIHYTYPTPDFVIQKMNHYSTVSAQAMHDRGKKVSIGTAIRHGLWAFFRSYVLRLGFLEGRYGFMLAVSTAENSYYRYIKCMLLNDHLSS